MSIFDNPFEKGTDHHQIWDVLIRSDFEGFLNQSWEMVASDYMSEGFFGINMNKTSDPNNWKLTFPTLKSYQDVWTQDCLDFQKNDFDCDPRTVFYSATRLENFEFHDDIMMVHKVFNGEFPLKDGDPIPLKWRSLFILRKTNTGWKINGFTGYI